MNASPITQADVCYELGPSANFGISRSLGTMCSSGSRLTSYCPPPLAKNLCLVALIFFKPRMDIQQQ